MSHVTLYHHIIVFHGTKISKTGSQLSICKESYKNTLERKGS